MGVWLGLGEVDWIKIIFLFKIAQFILVISPQQLTFGNQIICQPIEYLPTLGLRNILALLHKDRLCTAF